MSSTLSAGGGRHTSRRAVAICTRLEVLPSATPNPPSLGPAAQAGLTMGLRCGIRSGDTVPGVMGP